jgi:hypothetical protein
VRKALAHTGKLLFDPFSFGKWFTIGFCAWLATLGDISGPSMNYRFDRRGFQQGGQEVQDMLHSLPYLIPLIVVASVTALIFTVLFLWISSRGKFMFLYCTVNNCAFVKYPWGQFRRQGNSLFLFRLCLWILGLGGGLTALIGFAVFAGLQTAMEPEMAALTAILVAAMIGVPLFMIFWTVIDVTEDFVMAIMIRQGLLCIPAWKVCWRLIRDHFSKFVLYWLFLLVIRIAILSVIFAFVFGTCCVGLVLLIIPYIRSVVLLPVTSFKRMFSLYYFRQYGTEFDVFPPDVTVVPAQPAPTIVNPGV